MTSCFSCDFFSSGNSIVSSGEFEETLSSFSSDSLIVSSGESGEMLASFIDAFFSNHSGGLFFRSTKKSRSNKSTPANTIQKIKGDLYPLV